MRTREEIEDNFTDTPSEPLFDKAVKWARFLKKAHVANAMKLKKALGIGYGRASALIDQLEEAGIVSKAEKGKPRKVL